MPDLQAIRERLEWWRPGADKVLSATGMQKLLDDTAALLNAYDAAGFTSDRAQVLRATLELWEDNPPTVGRPVSFDSVFAVVLDANWLLGVIEGTCADA